MRRALTLFLYFSRSILRAEVLLVQRAKPKSVLHILPYFFFGEAFFEAFSGSSVVAPAKPRRSRGGALAFEIRMYPSRGPGTAPSTINRLSSRSIPRMRRLRTV